VRSQQRRDQGGIHQDVLVPLKPAAVGAVAVADERGGLPDDLVGGRPAELGDDRPVRAGPGHVPLGGADRAVLQVADVEREHPARPQRPGHGDQRAVDRRGVRQVADDVPDGHDRVRGGQPVVGEPEPAQVRLPAERFPGQLEHGRGGVRRDDREPRVEQVPGQRPGTAAEFEHEPAANWFEERQDARGAVVGVSAVTPRVDQGQVVLVDVHAEPQLSRRR
jgi:hypothetical protein